VFTRALSHGHRAQHPSPTSSGRPLYSDRMLRLGSCIRPAGGSPVRVGAGAPGSRPRYAQRRTIRRERMISEFAGVLGASLALLVALAFPVSAVAEGTLANPICPEEAGTLDQTYCARHEITAATKARREAEEAAPVTFLNIRAEKHYYQANVANYKEPGETFIAIQTNPFARVIIRDTFDGLISGRQQPPEKDRVAWAELLLLEPTGEQTEWVNESVWVATSGLNVPWSCQHPHRIYHYTVEARGMYSGEPIVRTGQIQLGQRSTQWCAAAKRKEAAATARKRAEDNRHYAERIGHERETRERHAQEQAATEQLFETNCRAIGGTPVRVQSLNTGNEVVVCRSPEGGTLPVP